MLSKVGILGDWYLGCAGLLLGPTPKESFLAGLGITRGYHFDGKRKRARYFIDTNFAESDNDGFHIHMGKVTEALQEDAGKRGLLRYSGEVNFVIEGDYEKDFIEGFQGKLKRTFLFEGVREESQKINQKGLLDRTFLRRLSRFECKLFYPAGLKFKEYAIMGNDFLDSDGRYVNMKLNKSEDFHVVDPNELLRDSDIDFDGGLYF